MKKNNRAVVQKFTALGLSVILIGAVPVFATEKEETVYGILNADGSSAKVIVSDFIHSDERIDKLTIHSNLEALTDLQKGDAPEISGDQVTWNVNGYELNYQGISKQDLPIVTQVSYFLDGVAVEADALIGKSGQLRIVIDQTNNQFEEMTISGEQRKLYVPYYSVTTMRLSSEVFANVKINQGKIISDGKNFLVTGLLVPGMKENFDGILDLKLEDELEITAEITNFEFSPIYIAMSNKLPEVDSIDALDELENLSDSLSQFQEAGAQLLSGAEALEAGNKTYFEKLSGATSGLQNYLASIGELSSKLKGTTGPVALLTKGAVSMNEGLLKWKSSAQPLVQGYTEFSKGTKAFADGAKILGDKVGLLTESLAKLSSNATLLGQSSNQLTDGLSEINGHMSQLSGGNDQLYAAMVQFQKSLDPNDANYVAYSTILKQMETMNTSAHSVSEGLKALNEKSSAFNKGLNEFAQKTAALSEAPKLIAEGASQLNTASTSLVENAAKLEAGTNQLVDGMDVLMAGSRQLSDGLVQYNDGILKMNTNLPALEDATSKLSFGFKALDNNAIQLIEGTSELRQGIEKFNKEGIQTMVEKLSEEGDKIDVAVEVKEALEQLSMKNNSFTGINEDLDSKVNYVLKITGETAK